MEIEILVEVKDTALRFMRILKKHSFESCLCRQYLETIGVMAGRILGDPDPKSTWLPCPLDVDFCSQQFHLANLALVLGAGVREGFDHNLIVRRPSQCDRVQRLAFGGEPYICVIEPDSR